MRCRAGLITMRCAIKNLGGPSLPISAYRPKVIHGAASRGVQYCFLLHPRVKYSNGGYIPFFAKDLLMDSSAAGNDTDYNEILSQVRSSSLHAGDRPLTDPAGI